METLTQLTDKQCARYEDLYADYKRMFTDPERATPKIIINPPAVESPPWEACYEDPALMLQKELAILQPHMDLEDDRVPTVRVQMGTAQFPAAFGCTLELPTNNLPAAKTHVLERLEDVEQLAIPTLKDGIFPRLVEYTQYFKEHLPAGIHIQHPDIQGPFNSAHLIRGNDILMDFYDDPELLGKLLDKVTDCMIDLVPQLKAMISDDPDWFFDWGSLWRGTARMCNCSVHMISPAFYRDHVMPRDIRLLESIGGGRMHYCGSFSEVIDDYFQVPCLNGLDFDSQYHNLWELCEKAPSQLVLSHWIMDRKNDRSLDRLLLGDWPQKRNIVVIVNVDTVEEGRDLLKRLRMSCSG